MTVPFLGGDIVLPAAPYVLASTCGAPVMHAFSIRKDGIITGLPPVVAHVPPHIRRDRAALEKAARRFAGHLEELALRYPYHFFNFHDLWSNSHDKE